MENKIAMLKQTIHDAKIIDTKNLKSDEVGILCTVEIKNLANGMTAKYRIVSGTEANNREGKISVESPIAKGLLGHKVGEKVPVQVPAGVLTFEILSISFEE